MCLGRECCVEGSCRVAYLCLCRECCVEGSCEVACLCLCRECCVEGSCSVAYLCLCRECCVAQSCTVATQPSQYKQFGVYSTNTVRHLQPLPTCFCRYSTAIRAP